MGFLSSIASAVSGAAKEEFRNGLVNGFLNGTGQSSLLGEQAYPEYEYDANGHIKGVNGKYASEISNLYGSDDTNKYQFEGNTSMGLNGMTYGRPRQIPASSDFKYQTELAKYARVNTSKISYRSETNDRVSSVIDTPNYYDELKVLNSQADRNYVLKIPRWGYADFINERAIWQKQIGNIFDEPGWFYFKIFFDFNTGHGLFGSLLNNVYLTTAVNSAAKYLNYLGDNYMQERPADRINALYKFASILSYISTNAPWYFKSVRGLDNLSIPVLDEFSKERKITIELLPDAIDMRLTTLMSLYKYACFDDYNHKEVIPENLRKFNMSIVIFQSPLRYLHTSFTTTEKQEFLGLSNTKKGKSTNYKELTTTFQVNDSSDDEFKDMMSFKIYSLYNCEFNMDSFAKVIPGQLTNDTPYQLGKNELEIKYDFCVEHQMNEFYEMMFGTNGFYFNQYANFQVNANVQNVNQKYKIAHEAQLERYRALQETFGNTAQGGTLLGLLDSPRSYKKAVDATEAIMNGMFSKNNLLGDLGTNFALGLLGSSRSVYAPQGNIYGDYGIDSAYYKAKLREMKYGRNENTMPSYEYDPKNAIAYERSKVNMYSTLEWERVKQGVSTFDMKNWLTTGAKKLGSDLNSKIKIF